MAQRIQLKRTKGWRKPEGAIVVARPTIYGNPFTIRAAIEDGYTPDQAAQACVDAYRQWLAGTWQWEHGGPRRAALLASVPRLCGHDLACWCRLDRPCHADVLLELANKGTI